MILNVRYKRPLEEPITTEVELHKNVKGYNIKIDGKFYFPHRDNPVLKHLEEFKGKELWVAVVKDEVNYGQFTFATPDYFIRVDEDNKTVYIEKEVPLNQIDNYEEPFKWDYVTIASCDSVEKTDSFIDESEELKVPEKLIKKALDEFYDLIS